MCFTVFIVIVMSVMMIQLHKTAITPGTLDPEETAVFRKIVDYFLPNGKPIDLCYWNGYFAIECIQCQVYDNRTLSVSEQLYRCYVHSDTHPRNTSTRVFRNHSVAITLHPSSMHPFLYEMDVEVLDPVTNTFTDCGVSDYVRIFYKNIAKISFTHCNNSGGEPPNSVFLLDHVQLQHLLI